MTPRDIPKSAGDLKREYEEMGRDTDGLEEKIAEAMFISLRWRKDIDCVELARTALAVVERERHDIPEGLVEKAAKQLVAIGGCLCTWDINEEGEDVVVEPHDECPLHSLLAALAVAERERNSCLCEFRPDEQLDPTVECLYHRNLRERAVDAEEKHRYWHERYDREVSALRKRPPLTEPNAAGQRFCECCGSMREQESLASSTTEEQAPDDCRYGLCAPDCDHEGFRG